MASYLKKNKNESCKCMAIVFGKNDQRHRQILTASQPVDDDATSYSTSQGLCNIESCSALQIFLLLADALYKCLFPRPSMFGIEHVAPGEGGEVHNKCYLKTNKWVLEVEYLLGGYGRAVAELSLVPPLTGGVDSPPYTVEASRRPGRGPFVMRDPLRVWGDNDDVYYQFGQGSEAEWRGTLDAFYNDFKTKGVVVATFKHPFSKNTVPCEVIFHKLSAQNPEFTTTAQTSNIIWKQKM